MVISILSWNEPLEVGELEMKLERWVQVTPSQDHYIFDGTTSKKPLNPINHYIQQCFYIPCITSSHNATTSHVPLHLVCHLIPYTTSSHRSLHPIYHFIPYITLSQIPIHPTNQFIPYAAYDMPLYPLTTS